MYDVVIAGGGPAGLSAALTLGRARRRVLVCDAGPRRNAAAEHVHGFLTRDGVTPDALRAHGRADLAAYPGVEVRDVSVLGITGERGAFRVALPEGEVVARRILLCTGLVDELLPIEGFAALWGRSIFQCPYCHGWERRDQRWACLARGPEALHFGPLLRSWTAHVTMLAAPGLPGDVVAGLRAAGLTVEERPIARLVAGPGGLEAIAFTEGPALPCDVLFAHPPQRPVALVTALGLALDEAGLVRADPMTRETSVPGVYAAGDTSTRMQAALQAAAAGAWAGATINGDLAVRGG
ncbi:MAG: NAD(P)/FAD-dependent oxidoreductase [Myxococcales bacterium]|nr:NAD(P)/FAD-dependent oxidoreductase [Myxococcales bacterium]